MTTALPVVTDNLSLYLTEIKKFDILSPEEEFRLAVRYYEQKDIEAAHRLVTSNLRFVVKIAAEYRNYGMKMLDLIQEGNIGLMMAVRKFNPYRGLRLISYAVWWIRAYIQNFIISSWSLVKIGTTQAQKKLFYKLNQTKNTIRNLIGADDLREAALTLDVTEEEAAEMDVRMQGEASLDSLIAGTDDITLLDTIADDRANQEELLAAHEESVALHSTMRRALDQLNEKERYIIEKRITADDPQTLQEIADHFGISRERIRQLEERALRKIRGFLEHDTVVVPQPA
ncbi:MAG: RNA polymerase sigma factor RpoH [Desulfuromonadia bacterium]